VLGLSPAGRDPRFDRQHPEMALLNENGVLE
jgi:hypothetical protein